MTNYDTTDNDFYFDTDPGITKEDLEKEHLDIIKLFYAKAICEHLSKDINKYNKENGTNFVLECGEIKMNTEGQ